MLHRTVPLELKLAPGPNETGILTGYGSVFGNVDMGGDVIEQGAFARWIAANQKPLPMLFGHDTMFPVGVWTHLEEDDHGLKVEGRLILDLAPGGGPAVPKAHEALAIVKAGGLDGLSIGYQITESRQETVDGQQVRVISAADLFEISLVVVPMNQEARVESAKSLDQARSILTHALTRAGLQFHEASRLADAWHPNAMGKSGDNDDTFLPDFQARLAQFARS